MRILIDMDGTLSKMEEMWLLKYNDLYDDDLTVEDITCWDVYEFANKCSNKQLYDIIHEPGFFLLPEPLEGSVEVLEELCENHEVYIVTAGHPRTGPDRMTWIELHYPFFDSTHVIFCFYKHLIKADILIDDGLHNLEKFEGIPIVFDRPWNRNNKKLRRVMSWKDVLPRISAIEFMEGIFL